MKKRSTSKTSKKNTSTQNRMSKINKKENQKAN